MVRSDRLPHALLVHGIPGLGKERLALRLSMSLLCEAPGADDACGSCAACIRFLAGSHPDFRLVTRLPKKDSKSEADLREQIVVDQVRADVIEALQLGTTYAGWKIAVISPAERLNRNAANALLKTLEEPAGRSLLILVTSRPSRLPATIRSRCQRIPVMPPARDDAIAWLAGAGVPDPGVALAMAGGAPLAAADVVDGELFGARAKLLCAVADLLQGRSDAPAVAQAWAGMDFDAAVEWLQTVVHDLVRLAQLGPGVALVNEDLRRDLQTLAQRLDWRSLHRRLDELLELKALGPTPVVKLLQWEGVMFSWSEAREGR